MSEAERSRRYRERKRQRARSRGVEIVASVAADAPAAGTVAGVLGARFGKLAEHCPHCQARLVAALRVASFVDDPQSRAVEVAMCARELRMTMERIETCDHEVADFVEEIRARRQSRELDHLLRRLGGDLGEEDRPRPRPVDDPA
jgi:hypothetical protein